MDHFRKARSYCLLDSYVFTNGEMRDQSWRYTRVHSESTVELQVPDGLFWEVCSL